MTQTNNQPERPEQYSSVGEQSNTDDTTPASSNEIEWTKQGRENNSLRQHISNLKSEIDFLKRQAASTKRELSSIRNDITRIANGR